MDKKHNEVELLLSCNLLKRLYPLLLFKALNDCPEIEICSFENCDDGILICESIKFFIENCYTNGHDDDLDKLYILLKNHIRIIKYILQCKKEYFTKTRLNIKDQKNVRSDTIEQIVSMKRMLFLLKKHNVLSVLKMTTNIHDQEYNVIQNLLKGSDNIGESDNFQAYCSIASALKAILLCKFYHAQHKQISKCFFDMVSYLSSLFPLSLRIETLENIFSLLFLRYEDFSVTNVNYRDDNDSTSFEKMDINKLLEHEKSGFICNKYVIRDLLYYLWDSTVTAACEIQKLENKEMKQLLENMSIFKSVLIDAQWRLKFYMKPYFIENVGIPEDESHNNSAVDKSEIAISSKSNVSHRVKGDTFFYKMDSTSEETKIKSDSSSESGLLSNNAKGKKRCKNPVTIADCLNDRQSLINLMLASKEILVLHCLWRDDIKKAQEIIKLFHMENTQLDGEVQFLDAFHTFKQDTFKCIDILNTKSFSTGNSRNTTLENIRSIAEEGIQTSRHTNQIETFLASQEPYLRMLSTNILNSNEMLTFNVLDLSLTIGQTYQISNNFCDVAMKYLKLSKTFDGTEHARFFSKIYQLFYEIKNNMSVISILCNARIPLSIKDWKENDAFWSDIRNDFGTFKEVQRTEMIENISHDNIFELEIIKKMSVIYDNNNKKFLQNICSHLQLLCTIIPNTNNDIEIRTISDLLKTSLHRYFGYQMFELQTEPDKLETIAFNLQVDLIYSILINTCPNVFYQEKRNDISNKNSDCIILNKNQDKLGVKNIPIKSPNEYISEILTELLQVLYNVSSGESRLNNSYLKTISNHTDIQVVLNKTSSLATLDLSGLSAGDETLTFLLNVWNVMFLHASLVIWSSNPPLDNLRHMVSLVSVGYMIGGLGLVTLASLRSKLLGNLIDHFKFFTRLEQLNESAWQDLDFIQNPKVIFAMANEFYGTPEIRIYETETLNERLNDAARDYISHYTRDCLTEQKVSLPDVIRIYQRTVSQNTYSNSSILNTNENMFLIDELKMLNRNIDIQYTMLNYEYEIILKYSEYVAPNLSATNTIEISLGRTETLRPSLLQYMEGHCWLLSYLVQRICNENPTIMENSSDNIKRTACLENLLYSSWVDKLKPLFNDNQIIAAIHDSIPTQNLWSYFESKIEDHNCENVLEILNTLLDNTLKSNIELRYFRDLILSHLLSNLDVVSIVNILQYLYQIKDIHVLAQTVLHNINKWPMNVCEHALFHTLQHEYNYQLPMHCKHQMSGILSRIMIFHKIIPYCVGKPNSTWYDVMYCTEKVEPFEIIKSLINADQFELCLEWLECQAFSLEIQPSVIQDFLIGLLKNQQGDFKQAVKFLQTLSSSQVVKLCKGVLKRIESTSALQFVTNYLLDNCSRLSEISKYRRTLVGINILKMLEKKERGLYIYLIKEPLLMLEQLLMNCKFESIQNILNTLHEELQHTDVDIISNFDKVIRFYARKSLDFRISLQRDNTENKTKNIQQSSLEIENNEFIMPVNVPTKEEWMPNEKGKKCSCCKVVIFSMFNRRHHCRRCGRVVCAVCSQHRMPIVGYPNSMSVRVCDDCKHQMILQTQTVQDTPPISSNEAFDYWRLTRDEKNNSTIRDEFSFEHAPNISLCLAILNLHSDHKMYTSFLLDRCDEMKQFLQPANDGKINPEVDHAVIIKMIRSLLVAAKVKCAKLGFNTGLAHCDRFLSQVDLIATLIQSDCLALIPTDELDEHILRKLRDLLTEKEQWILALDVSTKAGLDTQGVWAAWGKACLKVGCFDQARDKFYHCLNKVVNEDLDDWVVLTYPTDSIEEGKKDTIETTSITKKSKVSDEDERMSETHSKKNEFLRCRPLKDPPLLTEILQILDNLSIHRSRTQHSSNIQSDIAQEILQTLNNLKIVSQNQFITKHIVPANQTIYYQESLYYLLTYASYNSILQFFLRHKEFDKCLMYILENDLEPDLFLNGVYLYCLKNGDIEELHDVMKAKDSSLLIWRKYLIYVCHSMERKQYWHILYQIQLFMKDCIRASMTCIRFYTNEANTYLDLHNRVHLLQDAQRHLESELQIENLNKRKKSTCSVHSGQIISAMEMEPSEIDRHVNTICRQAEIAKFLANCEKEGRATVEFLNLFSDIDYNNYQSSQLPTLFGSQQQKIHLATLAILCGRDIEEGFGIAFRIMQDYNLPQQKVYSLAGHVLALKNSVTAIEQLVKCCRSSGAPNAHANSDYVLTHCVKLLLNRSYDEQNLTLKNKIDSLVRLITDVELRINTYIESKQLKAAYLLAVKHSRVQDIRRILKESDRHGQSAIKAICLKWLQQKPKE